MPVNAERKETLLQKSLARRWLYPTIAAALIGTFLIQALLSMSTMSATFDEPFYTAAGYSYWKTRDDSINGGHPPLMDLLIAIPLLPLDLTVPTDDRTWREWYGNMEQILYRSRIPTVLLGALLAVFVGKWAAELWGAEAGLAALLLFVFEPNILAHSRLATLDLGLTAFTFIAMFYVWKWLGTGHRGYSMLASVALGSSLLSKETSLAFLPIFFAQFVFDHIAATRRGLPRHVAPVMGFLRLLAGAAVVVVAVYAVVFHWHPLVHGGEDHRTVARVMTRIPILSRAAQAQIVAMGQHIMVPRIGDYVQELIYQRNHLVAGHPSYLMGHVSVHGWWYYYPVAFLIKTPLPILLLVITRLLLLKSVPMVTGEYVVILPIIWIMMLACFNTVDLGLRYILPIYPFLCIWLSRMVVLEIFGPGKTDGVAASRAGTA